MPISLNEMTVAELAMFRSICLASCVTKMRVWFLYLERFSTWDIEVLASAMLRRAWYGRYASSTNAIESNGRLSKSGTMPIQSGSNLRAWEVTPTT